MNPNLNDFHPAMFYEVISCEIKDVVIPMLKEKYGLTKP